MSRHTFTTQHQGRTIEVVMGWDAPLQYLHLTVEDIEADDDDSLLYSNLDHEDAFTLSLDDIRDRLAALGLVVPETMYRDTEQDRANNVSNRFVQHYEDGSTS